MGGTGQLIVRFHTSERPFRRGPGSLAALDECMTGRPSCPCSTLISVAYKSRLVAERFGASPTDPHFPESPLVQGSDGNFYGSSSASYVDGASGTAANMAHYTSAIRRNRTREKRARTQVRDERKITGTEWSGALGERP
jgi:hypothetical protein